MNKAAGFTLIEILVVVTIIATLAGLVVVLVPYAFRHAERIECMNNVRNLAGLLENTSADGFPNHSGPNLVLYLVKRGEIAGKDSIEQLFCPGDMDESLDAIGGIDAYKELDLSKQGEYGAFTSYAAPDQTNPQYRLRRGGPMRAILVDDSEDHHHGQGVVIGMTGGNVKWRDKFDDYELAAEETLVIGEGSKVEELRCFRVD